MESNFEFFIDKVFPVKNRGVVVTGKVIEGYAKMEEKIHILHDDKITKECTIDGIEIRRILFPDIEKGDYCGILLRNISKEDVKPGDKLIKY